MFTGIIEELGTLESVQTRTAGARLKVRCSTVRQDMTEGASIAVNGVCLTAVDLGRDSFSADLAPETLRRTNLGDLRAGSRVNLERPLSPSGRLSGHIVQGHVDGTGTVRDVREQGFSRVLEIDIEPSLARYLVEKGSVAVDGVSLTVSALDERGFSVSLIPETLQRTTLGVLREGALVNIEVDILAKHVERLLEHYQEARV